MIFWLNGAFGVGKTTTARVLAEQPSGIRVFDPETVGYMLQDSLTDRWTGDFQHWPPWRRLVVATALEVSRWTGEHLVCPQTVLDSGYFAEICDGLQAAGTTVFHVLLDAPAQALRGRIRGSGEAVQWRLDHVDAYLAARHWILESADLVIDVSRCDARAAASAVLTETGLA